MLLIFLKSTTKTKKNQKNFKIKQKLKKEQERLEAAKFI